MTQINPVQNYKPKPLEVGDEVTCDILEGMKLKIVSINGNLATVKSAKGNQFIVGLRQIRRA